MGVDFQNVAVAGVLGTLNFKMMLWLVFEAHRKRHMFIKHHQDYDPHTEYLVLGIFYKHSLFRCAPDSSHSNVLKFKVAVAAVAWVSLFKLCLWRGLWACQFLQKSYELTIVTQEVLTSSPTTRAGTPERVREKYRSLVFTYSYQLSVGRLTRGTVD